MKKVRDQKKQEEKSITALASKEDLFYLVDEVS